MKMNGISRFKNAVLSERHCEGESTKIIQHIL